MGRRNRQRDRVKAPTSSYDGRGRRSALELRGAMTAATRREYAAVLHDMSRTTEDSWQRAVEFLFERLAVRWTVSDVPTEGQKRAARALPRRDAGRAPLRARLAAHAPGRALPRRRGSVTGGPSRCCSAPVRARCRRACASACATPALSPMDPAFTAVMDETQVLLREAFATQARATLPLTGSSGAGHGGGARQLRRPRRPDRLSASPGMRGERLAGALGPRGRGGRPRRGRRSGARWHPDELVAAIRTSGCAMLAVVHGETSTGRRRSRSTGSATRVASYDALLRPGLRDVASAARRCGSTRRRSTSRSR